MRKYYIAKTYTKVNHAGVKPSVDFEDVLSSMGFRKLGSCVRYTSNSYICRILNVISSFVVSIFTPKHSIIFLQYPLQKNIEKHFWTAKKRGNKVVLLVHDLNYLRGMTSNYPDLLKNADALIVHTKAMKDLLIEEYDNQNIVILNLFDHLLEGNPPFMTVDSLPFQWHIVFAGNLAKSGFLDKIDFHQSNIVLDLFGNGFEDKQINTDINYHGSVSPEVLPEMISRYHFGLIWDGDSIDTCNGMTGEYLKYNSPYKTVSYLSAGLPIIGWKEMGISDFIQQHGIGFVVNSLNEIPSILKSMTGEEYQKMKNNVRDIQQQIVSGAFYRNAVDETLKLLDN